MLSTKRCRLKCTTKRHSTRQLAAPTVFHPQSPNPALTRAVVDSRGVVERLQRRSAHVRLPRRQALQSHGRWHPCYAVNVGRYGAKHLGGALPAIIRKDML